MTSPRKGVLVAITTSWLVIRRTARWQMLRVGRAAVGCPAMTSYEGVVCDAWSLCVCKLLGRGRR